MTIRLNIKAVVNLVENEYFDEYWTLRYAREFLAENPNMSLVEVAVLKRTGKHTRYGMKVLERVEEILLKGREASESPVIERLSLKYRDEVLG